MASFRCFNCAAPFRERLPAGRGSPGPGGNRFNCAAPFRERLPCISSPPGWSSYGFNCAAPFRERLPPAPVSAATAATGLQLCRPLSGAVTDLYTAMPGVIVD